MIKSFGFVNYFLNINMLKRQLANIDGYSINQKSFKSFHRPLTITQSQMAFIR